MNSKRIILFMTLAVLIGFAVGGMGGYFLKSGASEKISMEQAPKKEEEVQFWTCPMHPEVITEAPGNCPKCGMELVPLKPSAATEEKKKPEKKRKILYWRAPMDPTEIYENPGKSKMGMDLIPVYEDEQRLGQGGTITIDPVTVQNLGVKTAEVERRDLNNVIRTVGTVDYNEQKLYRVNTKISGWIENLYVDYTGKQVTKGDPLLEIYSPELVSTQEEYLLALKNQDMMSQSSFPEIKESAESLVKSSRRRLELWDIPESEIKALEKREAIAKTMKIISPIDGVVVQKNALEGMHIKEGMDLYHIADLSSVWVYGSIYEYELPWVKVGQRAEVELSYLPGKTFKGRVDYIYPYLEEKTRDVKVRLVFPNPNREMKPGMYANVRIYTPATPNALVIPRSAVIHSGMRRVVFVARDGGRFEPREIKLGVEGENDEVQVISGLLEGEEIVTSAHFLLDSESRLQEAIQKMMGEKKQSKEGREEE